MLEVYDPVAEWLEGLGCEFAPDARDLSIKEGACYVVQLTGHANLSSQGL